jgi:hypothetical protein
MKQMRLPIAILLIFWILLANASPALALPPLPCTFSGTVLLNGANPAAGTSVSAWINGVEYNLGPVVINLGTAYYAVDVPGDDPATAGIIEGGVEGQTVEFRIGWQAAGQTGTWQSGSPQTLNLAAVGYSIFLPNIQR